MKKQRVILIGASVVILAVGAVWFYRSPSPLPASVSITPRPVVTDGDKEEMTALLETRMDSLDKQVNNIQALYLELSKKQNEATEKIDKLSSLLQEVYNNQSKNFQASSTDNNVNNKKSIKDEEFAYGKSLLLEKDVEMEQNQEKELNRLEGEMAAQGVDMVWSSTAESQIRQSFAENFPEGSSIVNVKCQTTLCRVQVAHDSEEAKENFIQEFPNSIPWDHEGFFFSAEENGVISSSVYITRDANQ